MWDVTTVTMNKQALLGRAVLTERTSEAASHLGGEDQYEMRKKAYRRF